MLYKKAMSTSFSPSFPDYKTALEHVKVRQAAKNRPSVWSIVCFWSDTAIRYEALATQTWERKAIHDCLKGETFSRVSVVGTMDNIRVLRPDLIDSP
jgi:hypothetical protein